MYPQSFLAGVLIFALSALAPAAKTQVLGYTATVIDYEGGSFEFSGDGAWLQFGDIERSLSETARDEWSVHMVDETGGIRVQCDLFRRWVRVALAGGEFQDTYAITNSDDRVNARMLLEAHHAGGAFRVQPDGTWAELDTDGVLTHRYAEVGRAVWSVLLRDDSRGVDIYLDMHRRWVQYSDANTAPPIDLYQISSSVPAMGPQAPPLTLGCSPTVGPSATGALYSTECTATGGVAPYSFAITPLPDGLSYSEPGPATVTIEGALIRSGPYSFGVSVTDSLGQTSGQNFDGVAEQADPLLILSDSSLPSGRLGAPYEAGVRAIGGVQPYTWSVVPPPPGRSDGCRVAGLPQGLEVDAHTGMISGTPQFQFDQACSKVFEAVSFEFVVQVHDATGLSAFVLLQLRLALEPPEVGDIETDPISAYRNRTIVSLAGGPRVLDIEGLAATEIPLGDIRGLAIDQDDNLIVPLVAYRSVVRVDPQGRAEVVAGNGVFARAGDGGPAVRAALRDPHEVTLDSRGNLYIAESAQIRRVDQAGIITSLPIAGVQGMLVDALGNILVAKPRSNQVLRYAPDGSGEEVIAGTGTAGRGGDGGPAVNAELNFPVDLAFNQAGDLFIVDRANSAIRRIQNFSSQGGNGTIETVIDRDVIPTYTAGWTLTFDALENLYYGGLGVINRLDPQLQSVEALAGKLNQDGFEGDGGPALDAKLHESNELEVDSAGNLYTVDGINFRVRKIADAMLQGGRGEISTVVGNGRTDYSLDSEPAIQTSLTNGYSIGVAADGRVYIANNNYMVREIGLDGVVRRIAGTGLPGVSEDGTQIINGRMRVTAVTPDPRGGLIVLDNLRVRRIDASGRISTLAEQAWGVWNTALGPAGEIYAAGAGLHTVSLVANGELNAIAGTGEAGFSGDGGLATKAQLRLPTDVVADSDGNVYVADSQNCRVRRISSNGIIDTVAGNGCNGSSFYSDPVDAKSVSIAAGSLALDSAGNLLIAAGNYIHLLTPSGLLATVAGRRGAPGDGDGGPAVFADIGPGIPTIRFDTAGNLYIADWHNLRIRKVLAHAPSFAHLPHRIELEGFSGGPPVESSDVLAGFSTQDNLTLDAIPLSGTPFTATVTSGSEWLSVSPTQGQSPRKLTITADPAEQRPMIYRGAVQISESGGLQRSYVIDVVFRVRDPQPPRLSLAGERFDFAYGAASQGRTETLTVSNVGGGVLTFLAEAEMDSGTRWLSVSPASGRVVAGQPGTVTIRADPLGIGTGTYTGRIRFSGPDIPEDGLVEIVMTVSKGDQAVLLTQTGMTFQAVKDGGVLPTQSFSVLNLGSGSMGWTVSDDAGWLRTSVPQGSSVGGEPAPGVDVSINQEGLPAGVYYGVITVAAPTAVNRAQVITVFLEVLDGDSGALSLIDPPELAFTARQGVSPSSQEVEVFNVARGARTFRATRASGFAVEALPAQGRLQPGAPTKVVVQPLTDNLAVGDYESVVNFQFSDGRVQELKIGLTVQGGVPALRREQSSGCIPRPRVASTTVFTPQPAGWPSALQVVVECEGSTSMHPVYMTDGSVNVLFSNGDPSLALQSQGSGLWEQTWASVSGSGAGARGLGAVTLTIEAVNKSNTASRSASVTVELKEPAEPPVLSRRGIASTASSAVSPLARRSFISLYGANLSSGGVEGGFPYPIILGATQVRMTGNVGSKLEPIPIIFAGSSQVNVLVPEWVPENALNQLVVRNGSRTSIPIYVPTAEAQPAVFGLHVRPPGSADVELYGHTYLHDTLRLAAPAGTLHSDNVTPADAAPVAAGDVIDMYCSGLGATKMEIPANQATPTFPTFNEIAANLSTGQPVKLWIGGVEAQVIYAGLTPGFASLYQINATVPTGVSGDRVEVIIEASGQRSAPSYMAVAP